MSTDYQVPNEIANGDAPDADKIMGNFEYLENAINDFDGGNVTDETLPDSALVNNPETIRDETLNDFVVSGLTSEDPGASLTGVIAAGVAYIEGVRVQVNSFSHAYTASKDCYVDLDKTGEFHVTEVANGASEPAVYTNSLRICKFVTNGTEITSYLDKRVLHASGAKAGANYLWIAGILIQWGACTAGQSTGSGFANTFPIAFDATPGVTVTGIDVNPWIYFMVNGSPTTTGFVLKGTYSGSNTVTNYIAVGVKAVRP